MEDSSKSGDGEFDPPVRRFSDRRRASSSLFPPPEANLLGADDEDEKEEQDAEPEGFAEEHAKLEKDEKRMGPVWHVKVMTDDYEVKPRRPMPLVNVSDLLDNLENVNGEYIFRKPLNGWLGLTNCKLRSLTCAKHSVIYKSVNRLWQASSDGPSPQLPGKSSIPKATRATFVAPGWTDKGWSPTSPGFVYWFTHEKKLIFGEEMLDHLEKEQHGTAHATIVHTFAHRYPAEHETFKDTQTWHQAVLVEWSHGKFSTLVELAWRHGVGGYGGKSNWCEDKLEASPELLRAMPDAFNLPWDSSRSEIRVYDMPFPGKEGLLAHLTKYSEKGDLTLKHQRFKEPCLHDTSNVRIRGCTPAHLAGFLLNYIHRAYEYVEWDTQQAQNCQTFAADLFAFLAGKPGVVPFGAAIKRMYKQRTHSFMYKPS